MPHNYNNEIAGVKFSNKFCIVLMKAEQPPGWVQGLKNTASSNKCITSTRNYRETGYTTNHPKVSSGKLVDFFKVLFRF